ncbi:MAG: hypothetical protein ACI8ZN_000953 [Bacteroidia bacterium]
MFEIQLNMKVARLLTALVILILFLNKAFAQDTASHNDLKKTTSAVSDSNIYRYYVKYGNVPIFDTVWCEIVLNLSETSFDKCDAKTMIPEFKKYFEMSLNVVVITAKPSTERQYMEAVNQLKMDYVIEQVRMDLSPFKSTESTPFESTERWRLVIKSNKSHEMLCKNPEYTSSGNKKVEFFGRYGLGGTLGITTGYFDMFNSLSKDFYFLLPIKMVITSIDESKGKTKVYLKNMPNLIPNLDGKGIQFYDIQQMGFIDFQMDQGTSFLSESHPIKKEKGSSKYYIHLSRKESEQLSGLEKNRDEIIAVAQRPSSF